MSREHCPVCMSRQLTKVTGSRPVTLPEGESGLGKRTRRRIAICAKCGAEIEFDVIIRGVKVRDTTGGKFRPL